MVYTSHHLSGVGCQQCAFDKRGFEKRLTLDEFIERSREVHGNIYKYDKFVYVNNRTLGTITCPKHGDFEQSPKDHMRGHGCRVCGYEKTTNEKFLDQEEFLQRALSIHGGRFSYEKTIYAGLRNKVTITCNIHGDFEQLAQNHLNGASCPRCAYKLRADNRRETTEGFIKRSKSMFGDKFLYDHAHYVAAHIRLTLTCREHGDFEQTPISHFAGHIACPECNKAGVGGARTIKLTTEEFIERAKSVHGERYNYDKVNYIGSSYKVTITCPIHGDFDQLPNNHTKLKCGCPKCSRIAASEKKRKKKNPEN
jgi:hypothetical protein